MAIFSWSRQIVIMGIAALYAFYQVHKTSSGPSSFDDEINLHVKYIQNQVHLDVKLRSTAEILEAYGATARHKRMFVMQRKYDQQGNEPPRIIAEFGIDQQARRHAAYKSNKRHAESRRHHYSQRRGEPKPLSTEPLFSVTVYHPDFAAAAQRLYHNRLVTQVNWMYDKRGETAENDQGHSSESRENTAAQSSTKPAAAAAAATKRVFKEIPPRKSHTESSKLEATSDNQANTIDQATQAEECTANVVE